MLCTAVLNDYQYIIIVLGGDVASTDMSIHISLVYSTVNSMTSVQQWSCQYVLYVASIQVCVLYMAFHVLSQGQ